jgi:hypothetical protein
VYHGTRTRTRVGTRVYGTRVLEYHGTRVRVLFYLSLVRHVYTLVLVHVYSVLEYVHVYYRYKYVHTRTRVGTRVHVCMVLEYHGTCTMAIPVERIAKEHQPAFLALWGYDAGLVIHIYLATGFVFLAVVKSSCRNNRTRVLVHVYSSTSTSTRVHVYVLQYHGTTRVLVHVYVQPLSLVRHVYTLVLVLSTRVVLEYVLLHVTCTRVLQYE